MSSPVAIPAAGAGRHPASTRSTILAIALPACSVTLLIWSEIWLALAATEWSLVSLFGLGLVGYVVLSLILVPPALWASWRTAAMAWTSEIELAAGQG